MVKLNKNNKDKLIVISVLCVWLFASYMVFVVERNVLDFQVSQEECLKSLDCTTDQDCHDKAIKVCGYVPVGYSISDMEKQYKK